MPEERYLITPLTRLPFTAAQRFSYLCVTSLNPGDLVLIEFRRRLLEGIVLRRDEEAQDLGEKVHLKPVVKILEKNYVGVDWLKLMETVAKYYLVPFSFILKTALPPRVKARHFPEEKSRARGSFVISKGELQEARRLVSRFKKKKVCLITKKDRSSLYYYLVSRALNNQKQVLFLAPDWPLAYGYWEKLKEIFGASKVALLTKELGQGAYFEIWNKLRKGQKQILVGTRSAVFTPLKNLGLIIVESLEDPSFKQWDQNPRYDARHIAKGLAESADCPLVWGSALPGADWFWELKERKTLILKAKKKTAIKIVIDAKEPKHFVTSRFIGEMIVEAVTKKMNKSSGVFFVGVSQKGLAGGYYCSDCGYMPQCPDCETNYYIREDGSLRCPKCGKSAKEINQCPKCKSPLTRTVGAGPARIAGELKRIWPNQPVVILKEEGSWKERAANLKEALNLTQGFVLGSTNVIRLAHLNRFVLGAVALNPDKALFVPDPLMKERRGTEIASLTSEHYPLYLETNYPKGKILRAVLKDDSESFYNQTLKRRKENHLPPFYKLIKFSARAKKPEEAIKKLQGLAEFLKELNQGRKLDFFLGEDPYPAYPEKIRGFYIFNLLIFSEKLFEFLELDKCRLALGAYCAKEEIRVDVDPIEIM